jgi:3-phosphoshikimate 1-carboxyvinyltransferase
LAMIGALRAMGIQITQEDDTGENWHIRGCGGVFPNLGRVVVNAGLAGTVLRFMTSISTLAAHETIITGEKALLSRPIGQLLDALGALGAKIDKPDNNAACAIVRPGVPRGGTAKVDAEQSSQFASAILLPAPYFQNGLNLEVTGLGARGYVDMTVEMMRRHGAQVDITDSTIHVAAGGYSSGDEEVPGDASAASHIFTIAAATRGEVTVDGLGEASLQPDLRILDALRQFGCTVEGKADRSIKVLGPDQLQPIDVNLSATPDQLPNIAVLAALAQGTTVIRGVGITRFHETDRMAALERELKKVGITAVADGDDFIVHGGSAKGGATLHSHGDHRLGMAFASLGLALGSTVVENADCVEKTYPRFWTAVRQLGGLASIVQAP